MQVIGRLSPARLSDDPLDGRVARVGQGARTYAISTSAPRCKMDRGRRFRLRRMVLNRSEEHTSNCGETGLDIMMLSHPIRAGAKKLPLLNPQTQESLIP